MEARVPPPEDEAVLYKRAYRLAGLTVTQVADQIGLTAPEDLGRHKGWVGQLLEAALGATGGSKAVPDFPDIGVEMKTLPVTPAGKPRESTYVCVAPLDGSLATRWEDCWLRRKLSCVLWVPVVGEAKQPAASRRIGAPVLWRPNASETAALRADWEALAEYIHAGSVAQVTARMGQILQLRPKASSASVMVWTQDEEANWVQVNPRGFYLRTRFTAAILERHFGG